MRISERVTVVQPSSPWRLPDLAALYGYRDLLWLLIQKDFTIRYRQTLLGPLWFVIQPLALTGIFTLIFKVFSGLPTQGKPATLFYLAGLIGWTYFAQVVTRTGGTFIQNAYLFSKVWFPRLLMPLAGAAGALLAVALQLVAYAVLQLAIDSAAAPLWRLMLLPLVFLDIAAFALGAGLVITSSTAKYRDLSYAIPFLLQAGLFVTPVIYPVSSVPSAWFWGLILLNPLAPAIEAMRWCLVGAGTITPAMLVCSVIGSAATLIVGLLLFQRVERNVVDTV